MNQLLSALFALVIGGTALYYALPMLIDAQMQPAQNDAGNQISTLEAATVSYILGTAGQSPLKDITAGNPLVLTPSSFPTLYLPSTFRDFNVFGQSHAVVITQNSPGQFEALVYTYGGDTIPDNIAIRVAQAGPPNSVVYLSSDTADIEGAAGGELIPIAQFQNATHPIAVGHIGAHILPASLAAEAPFLNRYATGNLDDNTMHTAQYMDGNDLDMGATAAATAGGGNINMAGGNISNANQITALTLADVNTPSYQITPASTSNIKTLTVTANETIGTTGQSNTLTVNGNVQVNGDVLHFSDIRLKDNIRPITNPLAIVDQMGGYRYTWREDGKPDIGFIAQEVQRVAPELVEQQPNGYLAVKYDKAAALLAAAVKQQKDEIDAQSNELEVLRREVDALRDPARQ